MFRQVAAAIALAATATVVAARAKPAVERPQHLALTCDKGWADAVGGHW